VNIFRYLLFRKTIKKPVFQNLNASIRPYFVSYLNCQAA